MTTLQVVVLCTGCAAIGGMFGGIAAVYMIREFVALMNEKIEDTAMAETEGR